MRYSQQGGETLWIRQDPLPSKEERLFQEKKRGRLLFTRRITIIGRGYRGTPSFPWGCLIVWHVIFRRETINNLLTNGILMEKERRRRELP